jgi:hypothetical protein
MYQAHLSPSFFLNGFSTRLNHLILGLFLLKLHSKSNALSCILVLSILLHSQTNVVTSLKTLLAKLVLQFLH